MNLTGEAMVWVRAPMGTLQDLISLTRHGHDRNAVRSPQACIVPRELEDWTGAFAAGWSHRERQSDRPWSRAVEHQLGIHHPRNLTLEYHWPVMKRQGQRALGTGRDHTETIIAPTLLDGLCVLLGATRMTADDLSLASLTKPDCYGWTVTDSAPPGGINPGLTRTTRDTNQRPVPCSKDRMNPHHER